MLNLRLAILLLVAPAPASAAPLQEAKEPPLVMYVEADGKKIPVQVDKPFDLETKAGKTSLTLRMEPYRVFPYAGVTFNYPRGASFTTQSTGPMTAYILTDNPAVFMVQHFKGQSDPKLILKQMIEQMTAQYGKSAEVSPSDATLELDKRPLKGVRLEVAFAQQTIHQSLFSFASGKDTVVLILQDAPDEGKPTKSFLQFQKMVQDSFRFAK